MRKVTLSVVSFALGALAMSLLESQTSAQESTKPSVVRVAGAVPVVPPFRGMEMEGTTVEGSRLAVDGLLCRNCTFKDATLEYGGGEYALLDAKVSLPINLDLRGAALNTAKFLNTFGLIGCPANQRPPSISPIPPILKAAYAPTGTIKSDNTNP